jgi:hypothetical protein
VGFRRNAHTQELALEPKPLPEMNHIVTNAVVFVPEGTVTINYTESGPSFLTQTISCAASAPIAVSKIYVRDKYGSTINTVNVNDVAVTYTRVGTGFAKELCLNWSGTIGTAGVRIVVSDEAVRTLSPLPQEHAKPAPARTILFTGETFALPANYSGNGAKFSVYTLAGHLCRTFTTNKMLLDRKNDIKMPDGVYIVKIEPATR